MRTASYGSVPDALPGAPAPPLAVRRAGNWRRAGAAAVAALAVLAVAGVLAVRQGVRAELAEGCDEIECMINSATKPPGAVKVPPRTLNPDEVEKLKAALAEEEQLESKVCPPAARRAARWATWARCCRPVRRATGVQQRGLRESAPQCWWHCGTEQRCQRQGSAVRESSATKLAALVAGSAEQLACQRRRCLRDALTALCLPGDG